MEKSNEFEIVKCPVCSSVVIEKREGTPYWMCDVCDCWFQYPLPVKVYEAEHEIGDDGRYHMSTHEKNVNLNLAKWLSLYNVRNALDIGSKYPFLAACLRELGVDAYGVENLDIVPIYSAELGVPMILGDFEVMSAKELGGPYDLITLVHVFEHMYSPYSALEKIRSICGGRVFIRIPDHSVDGFERDLTVGHYTIHPFFYSLRSFRELIMRSGLFDIEKTYPLTGGGQRDFILTCH